MLLSQLETKNTPQEQHNSYIDNRTLILEEEEDDDSLPVDETAEADSTEIDFKNGTEVVEEEEEVSNQGWLGKSSSGVL